MSAASPVSVFDHLQSLVQRYRAQTRERFAQVQPDLSLNEVRVLIHTGRDSGTTQKQLTERSHTDKAQMARMLAALEARGLLQRIPSDADKRVRSLRLTAQGAQLYVRLREVQQQVAAELLQDWPQALQNELVAVLQQADAPKP